MSKCILDVWEGRIPTCMAGYLVCDEEKCPNFIQEVKIEKAIETLKARKKFIADINFDAHYAYDLAISALKKQERYEEELEMIYKMADDMALTGNVPSSKEHAEAIQNYLDWVEAGQMVEEVEYE